MGTQSLWVQLNCITGVQRPIYWSKLREMSERQERGDNTDSCAAFGPEKTRTVVAVSCQGSIDPLFSYTTRTIIDLDLFVSPHMPGRISAAETYKPYLSNLPTEPSHSERSEIICKKSNEHPTDATSLWSFKPALGTLHN